MTILAAYGLSLLLHHLFTAERGLKEAANDRFALLGRHASSIVHDIKGSIGIPYLYIQEAKDSLKNKDYEKTNEYLSSMERNLARIEKTIFDLNQLSRIVESDSQSYRIREALDDILGLLAKRLHDVEVQLDGDFTAHGDRGIVCSVFLNLVLNSLESFARSNTEKPRIQILANTDSRTITFIDNGGGFSREALDVLKSHQMIRSESSNSGLGLYLVAENLRAIKGQASFRNIDGGAKVEIKLP